MGRGQIVIAGIFGIAVIATVFSLSFRYRATHEALNFWGPQASRLIASPEHVELWKLEPRGALEGESPPGHVLTIADKAYYAGERREVTRAPGFKNAQSALTLSKSFEWDPENCNPIWSHALVFSRGEEITHVVLSIDCAWVYSPSSKKIASVKPIVEGLAKLFEQQLGS